MRSRLRIALFFLLLSGVGLNCSTTSTQSTEGETEAATPGDEPTSPPAPADPGEEAARYMHAGPAPVIVKARLGAIQRDVIPALQPFTSQLGRREFSSLLRSFRLRELMEMVGGSMSNSGVLDQIRRDRAVYASRQPVAGPHYFEALEYGAVIQPADVEPMAYHTRVLLPCDNPPAVATQLEEQLDSESDIAVEAGQFFVRVDAVVYLSVRSDRFSDDTAEQWEETKRQILETAKSRVVGADEQPRQTPALRMFEESDAAAAAYFRSEDLRRLIAARYVIEGREATTRATPENRMRILSMGASSALNAMTLSPAAEFEHEDTLLELRVDDAGGPVVDVVSTQTERGRAIASNIGEQVRLEDVPALDAEAQAHGDIRWNVDFAGAAASAPVVDAGPEDMRGSLGVVAEAFRMGGMWGYLQTLLLTPSMLLRHFADEIRMPTAGRVQFRISELSGRRPPEFSVVGAADFAESIADERTVPYLSIFRNGLQQLGGDVEFGPAEEDPTRLRVRTGALASGGNTEVVELDSVLLDAEMDWSPIIEAGGDLDVDALGDLTETRFDWWVESGVTRQRLHFGSGELPQPQLAEVEGFEPLAPASNCQLRATTAIQQTFTALGPAHPDSLDEVFAEDSVHFSAYDDIVSECAGEDPSTDVDAGVLRARARWLTSMRSAVREERMGQLRRTACELGDAAVCE